MKTAKEAYQYFLSLIRKERTSTVPPNRFNELIAATGINWVKSKLPETEFNQKRIDDLQAIHVLTDGIQVERLTGINRFDIPTTEGYKYMHGLSASFLVCKLAAQDPTDPNPPLPTNRTIELTVMSRAMGKILRADQRAVIQQSSYRKPDGTFVYFELRGGKIIVMPDEGSTYKCCEFEYYKYPEPIYYDPNNDSNSSIGSFNESQNREIVELAARKYLERVQDTRYKTFAGEQISTPT